MASLTFRAWYEARFGHHAWERLERIPRPLWMEYLIWYRRVLALPVENGIDVVAVGPDADGLRLETSGGIILARKLVLATGRGGLSRPSTPDFMTGVPRPLWAHSSDDIDFCRLARSPRRRRRRRCRGNGQRRHRARTRRRFGAAGDPARQNATGQQADGHRQRGFHQRLSSIGTGLALALHALCRAAADAGAAQLHPARQPPPQRAFPFCLSHHPCRARRRRPAHRHAAPRVRGRLHDPVHRVRRRPRRRRIVRRCGGGDLGRPLHAATRPRQPATSRDFPSSAPPSSSWRASPARPRGWKTFTASTTRQV